MAYSDNPPIGEPARVQAGERWLWKRPGGKFPASEWDLSYAMVCASAQQKFSHGSPAGVSITADGDSYLVDIPASVTSSITVGSWRWQAKVTNKTTATEIYIAAKGTLFVEADFSATAYASGLDDRTTNEVHLDNLNAAIEALSSNTIMSYTVAGRTVTKRDLTRLLEERKYIAGLVEAERNQEARRQGKTGAGTGRIHTEKIA